MSLTSYRAAPSRVNFKHVSICPHEFHCSDKTKGRRSGPGRHIWRTCRQEKIFQRALCRPGSDLLSRVLRRSTISAGAFHGRVRNGNGCSHPAKTTRSAKRTLNSRSCCLFVPPSSMGTENENDQADRAISTGKLQALPLFHTRPINVVVFHDSRGILVFRWVSRLDAFSGYPVRT